MSVRHYMKCGWMVAPRTAFILLAMSALCGCSTDYRMVEVWRSRHLERTFLHEFDDGPDVGLICKELGPGIARVSITIVNDGPLPIIFPHDLKLFVDGERLYSETKPLSVTIYSGDSMDFVCKTIFRSFTTHAVTQAGNESSQIVRIYQDPMVVHATIGPYRSPDVVIDLIPENQVPFRFSEEP